MRGRHVAEIEGFAVFPFDLEILQVMDRVVGAEGEPGVRVLAGHRHQDEQRENEQTAAHGFCPPGNAALPRR